MRRDAARGLSRALLPALAVGCVIGGWAGWGPPAAARAKDAGVTIAISKDAPDTAVFAPLDLVVLTFAPAETTGRLRVRDGRGRVYVDEPAVRSGFRFLIRGALGPHSIELSQGTRTRAVVEIETDAVTRVRTAGGKIDKALVELTGQILAAGRDVLVDGARVRHYLPSLRGNNQVLRAARYFDGDVKSFPALFLRYQKDNGALFGSWARDDHFDPFSGTYPGVHLDRDIYGDDFTGRTADRRFTFTRSPVEADVEALAVEHAYQAWQASGDDRFIAAGLPALERGLRYLLSDPLRYSSEHGLVKRGFTIDMWNLQHPSSARLHPRQSRNRAGWQDLSYLDADSPMGIAHGDNSAVYGAATKLARLFAHLGRPDKAAEWTTIAEGIRVALNRVAWNGTFFRHFVRLGPGPEGAEVGANEARQLSFSNPLAITRGITTHGQAVSIIAEYQRRREKTKRDSLAEWFTIDPWFAPSFGYLGAGEWVNGTVTPALAGDLALAAFRHGQEAYGADIVARLIDLRERRGGLAAIYHRGPRPPSWHPETFSPVDLRAVANRHLRGDRENGFINHPSNDLREFPVGARDFLGKRFDVIDPEQNGGKAAVVVWGSGNPGPRETVVSGIGKAARSIYFLHSAGNVPAHTRIGEYVVAYADGTRTRIPLVVGRNINNWWAEHESGEARIAWRGKNPHASHVATGVWGWNNRHPEQAIDSITIRADGNARVQLLGITLSDTEVQFPGEEANRAIPAAWAVGPVIAALIEGLCGVTDEQKVFDQVTIAPRFLFADERRADVTVHYPASRAYVAYRFEHEAGERLIRVRATGSGRRFDFHVPLPGGAQARSVTVGKQRPRFSNLRVEESNYVDVSLDGPFFEAIEIRY